MSKEILLAANIPADHVAYYEEFYTIHRLMAAEDKEAFLAEVGPRIDAVLTSGVRGFNKDLLDALPNVKMVSVWGAGLQALDLDTARERGIAVTNTPDNSKIAVAELGVGLLLAACRWIPDGDNVVKSGRWESESYSRLGTGLTGKKCGIVAMGTIGRAVAKRLEAFDLTISYYGPRKKDDLAYTYFNDVKKMAEDSDFLILCCPETDNTRGLIDAAVLKALGEDGILVNIARGKVVDEDALTEALEVGGIKAAACDVFADEPRVPKRLRNSDRLIAVPHIGTQLSDVRQKRKELALANLQAFFAGEPMPGFICGPDA